MPFTFARMKTTPLHARHHEMSAKMVPFAGFDMPVSYEGIKAEHKTVREAVGVFDVSHMGEFVLRGPGALALIQRLTSNDAAKLADGKVQYSCLPNGKGGIIDDLLVYRFAEEEYMLVVNSSNIEKDWEWISRHNTADVEMEDISDATALLAVQGPLAAKALQDLTDVKLDEMPYYTFQVDTFAGVEGVIISATGYTGAGGFELYIPAEKAELVWMAIFKHGEPFGIKPIGLGARDTLRLEMGYCLYGNDITDSTNPIEAGLGWITKFSKDFIDKDFLQAQKADGPTRKLVGLNILERGIARQHAQVEDEAGNPLGEVTSGTESPTLGRPIAMAYIQAEEATPGQEVFVVVRDKRLRAQVTKLPFLAPAVRS